MNNTESLEKRAQKAALLDMRIEKNVVSQNVDLVEWIFERLHIEHGENVLELCCGTGMQTLEILKRIGESGKVVALDISRQALDSISSKVETKDLERLTLVESDMDSIVNVLKSTKLGKIEFDKVFCAYGLYYSKNAEAVLHEARNRLSQNGSIIVVGPFGPNNGPLFNLLEKAGVVISDYVRFTSQNFMNDVVVPWAAGNFKTIRLHTVVNEVRWCFLDDVLSYWKSSTFYDENKLPTVSNLLEKQFTDYGEFVNKKWIMMVEMTDGR